MSFTWGHIRLMAPNPKMWMTGNECRIELLTNVGPGASWTFVPDKQRAVNQYFEQATSWTEAHEVWFIPKTKESANEFATAFLDRMDTYDNRSTKTSPKGMAVINLHIVGPLQLFIETNTEMQMSKIAIVAKFENIEHWDYIAVSPYVENVDAPDILAAMVSRMDDSMRSNTFTPSPQINQKIRAILRERFMQEWDAIQKMQAPVVVSATQPDQQLGAFSIRKKESVRLSSVKASPEANRLERRMKILGRGARTEFGLFAVILGATEDEREDRAFRVSVGYYGVTHHEKIEWYCRENLVVSYRERTIGMIRELEKHWSGGRILLFLRELPMPLETPTLNAWVSLLEAAALVRESKIDSGIQSISFDGEVADDAFGLDF